MDNLKSIIQSLQPDELALIHQGSAQEVSELLDAKGVELGHVSNADGLRLIRDSMAALSDDDLMAISGGEIGKVLGITVATVTASVVAGAVAGTAIGIDAAVR